MTAELAALDRTISRLTTRLLEQRTSSGHWEGSLSSSAVSTATSAIALMVDEGQRHDRLVDAGRGWLVAHQNHDGGWGDTAVSASNLSTTLLCWSALSFLRNPQPRAKIALERAEAWLRSQVGDLRPETLTSAILAAYGNDRTFSAPILTVLALTGKLGPESAGWRFVPQLPFELAACPHRWFEWLRLPVVSYALPALVAIGQARHHHRPTRILPLAMLRSALRSKTLTVARRMQPESGGYLEATPLTSFVVMSLIESGNPNNPIVEYGVRFLMASARADGSWPIDTNLATWVTTLSVDALEPGHLPDEDKKRILEWLLRQQSEQEHPFTHAKPGGWAWTNLSGGVPDADDTAGALLAIWKLCGCNQAGSALRQAVGGIDWLLELQNRDGGIPTFCRGWGALPFDRSAPDLTAHALQAWSVWYPAVDSKRQRQISTAGRRAVSYLTGCQQSDGSWIPLWFGNEHMTGHVNLTYGTSRVVGALTVPLVRDLPAATSSRQLGMRWLLRAQNPDGGWGGGGPPSSIEETGIAVHALAAHTAISAPTESEDASVAIVRGARWLIAATEEGQRTPPTPIGLYFARLWYYERLYPLIFALSGLSVARTALAKARVYRASDGGQPDRGSPY